MRFHWDPKQNPTKVQGKMKKGLQVQLGTKVLEKSYFIFFKNYASINGSYVSKKDWKIPKFRFFSKFL